MLSKNKQIFISFHLDEKARVVPVLEQIRTAGWDNIISADICTCDTSISQLIKQSDMFIVFLSKAYVQDESLMLEEFAYASTIERKHFIPVWLDKLNKIQKNFTSDAQILSILEMLTAKHTDVDTDGLIRALTDFVPFEPEYTPSTPQICEKPCEAYDGKEPYAFISYAHDNAQDVYPVVKNLYKSGWDLWYDEGIKTTQRYLPVIADHVKRCSAFVLMLTPRCLERPFVMNYELEFALRRGIPIVPVMLQEIHIIPSYISPEAVKLIANAISPNEICSYLERLGVLGNRGEREAIPPMVRQNVVYDVVLPPKLPGFEIAVVDGGITINKYVGNDTEVIIPKEVKTDERVKFQVVRIHDIAFVYNNKPTSITIPGSITSIGATIMGHAFHGCENLKEIIVLEDNMNYSSDSGVLFDKSKSVLIAFPEGKTSSSYYIPDSVKTIRIHAFMRCNKLLSVTIPDSVKSVEKDVFCECDNLTVHCSSSSYNSNSFPYDLFSNEEISYELFQKLKKAVAVSIKLPCCEESPYALVCCADDDLPAISEFIIEMYWEGFSVRYMRTPNEESLQNSACVLAFFSENTEKCEETVSLLQKAIARDKANIIQIFLGECTSLPNAVSNDLKDRQAIIQNQKSKAEFEGLLKESLRTFKCTLNHPRGFEAVEDNGGACITKFISNAFFPHVVIPRTMFNPPLPVTSIGEYAFNNGWNITSIIIPDSVTTIGTHAFYKCEILESITIPDSVTKIGGNAFCDCESLASVIIGNGVTSIKWYTFLGCNNLTSIIIGNSVTSIGGGAFQDCKSLSSITIPDSVKTIEERVFQDCTSLISVTISNGVTSIGKSAFQGCASLDSITIPNSVTNIGDNAFWDCASIASINVDLENASYSSVDGVLFNKAHTELIKYPKMKPDDSYIIPDNVTGIVAGAFEGCTNLVLITIPNSVTSIGEGSFCDCPNLTNITIPNSITKIEDGVFYDCVGLMSITIPDSVTYIGEEVFSGCTHLIIQCNSNSYAEQYAKENNIQYKLTKRNLLTRLFEKKS